MRPSSDVATKKTKQDKKNNERDKKTTPNDTKKTNERHKKNERTIQKKNETRQKKTRRTRQKKRKRRRSYIECRSIIAFRIIIRMMSAAWQEHTTLTRRMREYYCLGHGHLHDERNMA